MCCLPSDVFLVKSDFGGSDTSYSNKVMKGMRYRLILDRHLILRRGIEYEDKEAGGFDLLTFTVGDDTILTLQFY